MIEAGGLVGLEADMPFAGMVGAVALLLQVLGGEGGPVWDHAGGHYVGGGLLGVVASEEATTRGAAAGGRVALGEAEAVAGQKVDVGGVDVATVAASV